MSIETIRQEALSFPPEERARLAEQLLSSLDALSEAEVEQLWFQVATDRATGLDKSLVERIPAEQVWQRLWYCSSVILNESAMNNI